MDNQTRHSLQLAGCLHVRASHLVREEGRFDAACVIVRACVTMAQFLEWMSTLFGHSSPEWHQCTRHENESSELFKYESTAAEEQAERRQHLLVNHLQDYRVPAFPTPVASLPAISLDRPHVDPLERILRAYDRAINACESFDHAASRTAIGTLRKALQLDTPEARSFDSLYAWCESTVDRRDFVGPARCLRSLRDAWCRAAEPRSFTLRSDRPVS